MHNNRSLQIAFLVFGLAAAILSVCWPLNCALAQQSAAAVSATSSDIKALLAQLQKVLAAVQGEISTKKLPTLKSVQLNLQTGMKQEVDGSLVLFIFTVGASASAQTIQTLNMTLTPPPPPSAAALADVKAAIPDFNKEFAKAIIDAAESVDSALKSGTGTNPKLVLGSLEASINFTYENVIQGGVKTAKLLPITVELTGKVTPSAAQKAILTFGKAG